MRGLIKNNILDLSEHEKLRAIFDSSPDVCLLIDKEHRIIAYNRKAAYGAKIVFSKQLREEANIKEFYLENSYERFEADLNKVFQGEAVIRDEKLVFPNKVTWFEFRFFPVFDTSNNVVAATFHAIDISEFKKDKKYLYNERRLFEQGPAVAFKWTLFKENSVTKFVSPNVESIFGYKPEELMDKSFLDFIHEEDIKLIEEQIDTKVAQELRVGNSYTDSSYRVKCADGEYKWVYDYSFLAKESDGEKRVYGYLIDISEQKKITLELEEKNNQLKEALDLANTQAKILEVTTHMVMFTDIDGNITWINKSFEDITGYTLAEVYGKKPSQLFAGEETDEGTIKKIREAVNQRKKVSVEFINYKKNGEKFWVELKTEPIYDEAGNLSAFLSIQNDITERKIIEEKLNLRNEQLKKFSFTTSHELRHEFAKILSLLENKDILTQHDSSLDILGEINIATKTMNTIISKMNEQLYISDTQEIDKIEELTLKEVDEICLIDDDDIVCFINKKIISSTLPDKKIEIFNSADEAITYFKTTPASLKRYIFLDLNMPIKSGWNFLQEYKALKNSSPVIILTSSIDAADRERARRYPEVVSFFSKPLTNEKLKGLL
jgi:PAS domain S-box-containing protein